MGQRLTLPLILLAILLAGGAFFWLSDGARRAAPGARPEGSPTAPEEPVASVPLVEPGVVAQAPSGGAPTARTALVEPAEGKPAASKKAAGSVNVSGQVIDRFGTPVAGASVTAAKNTGFPMDLELEEDFSWLARQRTETDAQGRFQLAGVEPGVLQVLVRAHGFAPYEQRGLSVPSSDATLAPFTLARGAVLSGQVVDPDGHCVPGAKLVALDSDSGPEVFIIGQREPTAVTGPDGSFRIDELACGAWRFQVHAEEFPDLVVEGVAEQPGVEQAGLRWQLAPGSTVAGTVTGVPGEERDEIEVRAVRGRVAEAFDFGPARIAKVASNGSFLVRGLEPGETYALQARAHQRDAFSPWERSRSESVQAKAGDSGVILAYQPEAALLFTVYDAKTHQPLEKLDVESGIDWTQPLRDDNGRPRTVFPGGAVRVGGLRPGGADQRVQLVVKATGYRDFERTGIAVAAGQELDLGAIELDPVPLLRVHVLDGKNAPVAEASVRAQKQEQGGRKFKRTVTLGAGDEEPVDSLEFGEGRGAKSDADGWAEITSFEGETVQLSVRATGFAPFQLDDLVLPKSETLEQEVHLVQGGEVLVHVQDEHGLAKSAARVEHRSGSLAPQGGMMILGGGGGDGSDHVTDSEGNVLFSNLEAGPHKFRLDEGGGGGGPLFATGDTMVFSGLGGEDSGDWSEVQVSEGQRSELVLRAAPRGSLAGRVHEAGKILAGASLHLRPARGEGEGSGIGLPGMGGGGPEARSDGEGRYSFADVKEGRYTLSVEHPTRRMPQEFELEVRSGENAFDVDLPLSILEGRVLDQGGKGLAGVRVWAERAEPSGGAQRVRFAMVIGDGDGGGGLLDSGQFGERATTDEDGRYSLRGVSSDVDLVVKAEGDTVQPGQSETVRVAPDEVKKNVELRLEAAGSIAVEAKLGDGSPARMQLVQAEYQDESPTPLQPKFGFIQSGTTTLKGLRPGRWKVNVRNASSGPRGAGGQDQVIEVKPQETAAARFEVE